MWLKTLQWKNLIIKKSNDSKILFWKNGMTKQTKKNVKMKTLLQWKKILPSFPKITGVALSYLAESDYPKSEKLKKTVRAHSHVQFKTDHFLGLILFQIWVWSQTGKGYCVYVQEATINYLKP